MGMAAISVNGLQPFSRCHLKVFQFLALLAILFNVANGGAEPF